MSQVDPEIKALQHAIFLSKVAQARRMSMGEKFAAGPLLFDQNCRIMRDEIRVQYPDYTEEQVEDEVRRRLAVEKQLSDGDIYVDAGMIDE